jgi:hypothetical protein
VAAAAVENRELSQSLERLREEYQATRETLEQLLQLQASSDRSSMRQVGALLRTVQELAARSQRSALAAAAGDAAEAGGGGSEREDGKARSGMPDGGGQVREDAEWSVEQSLQRLVVSMGDQIREKAALISRLEASAAQAAGEPPSASPSRQAQQAAVRQLQAQVGELRQRRDEVRREMAEAEKRLSDLRRMEAAAQQARPAQRPTTAAAGPTIKIKEPLRPAPPPLIWRESSALTQRWGRERQEKELQALRQRLVEQQSKHALETDRLRRLLSEARARLQLLEAAAEADGRAVPAEVGPAAAAAGDLEMEMRAVEAQCSVLAARLAEAEQGSAAIRFALESSRRRSVRPSMPAIRRLP